MRDSHYIPKAAYKHVRGTKAEGSTSPVKIDFRTMSASQTDAQFRREMLCIDCEDLFSKNGERRMGMLWATEQSFPLLEMLKKMKPSHVGQGFEVYQTNDFAPADIDSAFYFAVSIIWRAQVWDWGRDIDPYRRALGEVWESKFKNFLLYRQPLENVYLSINVNSNPGPGLAIVLPICKRAAGGWLHSFTILGIKFDMYIGDQLNTDITHVFTYHDSTVVVVLTDHFKSQSFNDMSAWVNKNVVIKGKVADRFKGK
ncbi:hypothetical protein [Pseudomonas syringae]|uniref:DUF4238 domain-containing protein n=1 Tax=Pseudomonas syringae CC1417 TaxID=1357272 RepID=A0AAU8LDV1_PSESX